MRTVCDYIASHAGDPLTLARLARISGYSPAYLQRTFKAEVGVSPREFVTELRLAALKSSLRSGSLVADAVYAAGFGSTSRAYARVDGRLGMTPSAYRAGGTGETIAYASRDTVLGPLLMAATDRGVCFAQFGTSQAVLVRELAKEFPNAQLVQSGAQHGAALDDWLALLNEHLAGQAPRPDLPLDVRGTAFQVRVWNCLMSIADGDVVSYGELAARLRSPSAVRAVASACARNRIAVLIPCHRVLRSDGTLGGYRWGLDRKRALIDAERRRSRSAGEA
jgi:AraC family transcriptional regulator of adaptative response/methylated-DNA-[protein]-cysteine methyltransferase